MTSSIEIVVDAVDADAAAGFWKEALGYERLFERGAYTALGPPEETHDRDCSSSGWTSSRRARPRCTSICGSRIPTPRSPGWRVLAPASPGAWTRPTGAARGGRRWPRRTGPCSASCPSAERTTGRSRPRGVSPLRFSHRDRGKLSPAIPSLLRARGVRRRSGPSVEHRNLAEELPRSQTGDLGPVADDPSAPLRITNASAPRSPDGSSCRLRRTRALRRLTRSFSRRAGSAAQHQRPGCPDVDRRGLGRILDG